MKLIPRRSLIDSDLIRPNTTTSVPRKSGILWLDKNENRDLELRAILAEIIRDLDTLALVTYPEAAELYKKLAKWVDVDIDCLMLAAGSDGVIRNVFEAFVNEGDCIFHTNPTFAMYSIYAKMFGAKVFTIDYQASASGPFLDTNTLMQELRNRTPKILFLPNPDSPTGSVLSSEVLKKILAECERVGTICLVDEAYHPFYNWTAVPWIKKFPNLIVARTFSKAWGAAGVRIGYAIADQNIISYLQKMRSMYEVGSLSVAIAEKLLNYSPKMKEAVGRMHIAKNYFIAEMKSIGLNVFNCEGNFVHIKFNNYHLAVERFLDGKVLYKSKFDHIALEGCSRFSIGTIDEMKIVVGLIKCVVNK